MWSVAAPRAAQAPRDLAPSKWSYRWNRLMLRPTARVFITRVLPAGAALGLIALWASQPAQVARFQDAAARAWSAIESRPEFRVSAMAIEGAGPDLQAAIRAAVPLDFPLSQFELDLAAMRETVAALPQVKSAALRIRTGGVLEVRVQERLPVAIWRSPEGLFLVDGEGTVTAPLIARNERPGLPLIAGAGAPAQIAQARAILEAAEPIKTRLRALVRRGERRWDLLLDGDLAILLPAEQPVEALERVVALDEATELLSRDLRRVDLRVAHRPTLRLSREASLTLRDARMALSKEH